MDGSKYPVEGFVWDQNLVSEWQTTCKQCPCLVVCDKPGCTGCPGKNSFRDRAWQIHVVSSSLGSFVVRAKGTLNSGPFPVVIKQLLPPSKQESCQSQFGLVHGDVDKAMFVVLPSHPVLWISIRKIICWQSVESAGSHRPAKGGGRKSKV